MGQYYKFINKTRKEESQVGLPFNFGLPWAKSLENVEDEEVEAMFRFVIKNNEGWSEEDEVVAIGDYGEVIDYEPTTRGYPWEDYKPAPVPPKKLDDLGELENEREDELEE